jgi:hypothetical protein
MNLLHRPGRSVGLVVPRHRGTTANLCSLYPWHTGPGIGQHGVYIGSNVTGGGSGWFFDPFELYGVERDVEWLRNPHRDASGHPAIQPHRE